MYDKLRNTICFKESVRALEDKRQPIACVGLSESGKSLFAYAMSEYMRGERTPILVVVQNEVSANDVMVELSGFDIDSVLYPYVDRVMYDTFAQSKEYVYARLQALDKIANHVGDKPLVVVASIHALAQFTIPKKALQDSIFDIAVDDVIDMAELSKRLVELGYSSASAVEGTGQFSKRGGIVDIFSASSDLPVRIEFFGDVVDTISYFSVETQRRVEAVKSFRLMPADEFLVSDKEAVLERLQNLIDIYAKKRDKSQYKMLCLERIHMLASGVIPQKLSSLLYEGECTLFDYLQNSLVLVFDERGCVSKFDDAHARYIEEQKALFEEGLIVHELAKAQLAPDEIWHALAKHNCIYLESLSHARYENPPKAIVTAKEQSAMSNFESMELLFGELKDLLSQGYEVVIQTANEERKNRLEAILRGAKMPLDKIGLVIGKLRKGVYYPVSKFAILTDSDSRKRSKKKRTAPTNAERIKTYSDIVEGDYVVHQNHGVGKYVGIHQLKVEGVVKDYIKILYQGKDVLYVPANQLDLVYKYIGGEDKPKVKLAKLGGSSWATVKNRVKAAAREMAQELIALYSERRKLKGFSFPADSDWQKQFEEDFDYVETDDQLRSAVEIKADMEKAYPMDRLLCADVGFGKTEVALRAAFKAVQSSKQVAMLVPTTILAWQHYSTILSRFADFPVRCDTLSRFRTPKERKEILSKLKSGELDLVVGTHSIIQKGVEFKDLGLVIIDEEQRFGVAHKEKFKQMSKDVDVLTLTATPIPRTLNMALTGIRDISVIETPPADRVPVQTYVLEHDDAIIADACRKELRRGGQVFYLHNRIDTIEKVAAALRVRLPDANIVTAHGKTSEKELSAIWHEMVDGEIDILVSTTIIETGVDVPNANTLIIEDADRLGLSQLYQLRGRVGRSSRRAYAFFTHRAGKVLTEEATKRLLAIKEFTKFGSGFKIAMRDLEIRGAGNVLGAEQHGHMDVVGYDMYLKLLDEAVLSLSGKEIPPDACNVDFTIDANIDKSYIENTEIRIDIYKKIATLTTQEELGDLLDELIDRFGDVPLPLHNLCRIALLRANATNLRIRDITEKNKNIVIDAQSLSFEDISRLIAKFPRKILFSAGEKPYLTVRLSNESSLDLCEKVIAELSMENGT